jgi:LPXTG-motif cell wall-anchored protein
MYGSMRPEDEKEYGSAEAGDNTVALTAEEIAYNRSKNRSQRYGISGGEFTAQIYPDEYIQVANVSRGVTYEVSETPVDGYVNFAIEYKIDGEINTDDPKTMTSDQSHQVIVKNKKLPPPTIDITVRKVDKDNVDNMSAATLPGAAFTLEKYTTSEYQNKDPEWTEQSKEDSDNASAGIFSFADLTEGYYQLVETACPGGYVQTSSNPRFHVKKEGTELKVYIVRADGQEVLQTEMLKIENQSINVGNEHGAALPNTGGSGTGIFYLSGLMLAGIAGFWLVMRKRSGMRQKM